jgi:hypothetical protein
MNRSAFRSSAHPLWPRMQCKKTRLKYKTQEQRRPTPSCPDARHHCSQAARPSVDLQEVMVAPSVVDDANNDDHNKFPREVSLHHHSRRNRRTHHQDLRIHHQDDRSHQPEGSGHAGRCLRCSAPSCSPSSPFAPSSSPSLATDASPQAGVAPSCPSSRIV